MRGIRQSGNTNSELEHDVSSHDHVMKKIRKDAELTGNGSVVGLEKDVFGLGSHRNERSIAKSDFG